MYNHSQLQTADFRDTKTVYCCINYKIIYSNPDLLCKATIKNRCPFLDLYISCHIYYAATNKREHFSSHKPDKKQKINEQTAKIATHQLTARHSSVEPSPKSDHRSPAPHPTASHSSAQQPPNSLATSAAQASRRDAEERCSKSERNRAESGAVRRCAAQVKRRRGPCAGACASARNRRNRRGLGINALGDERITVCGFQRRTH